MDDTIGAEVAAGVGVGDADFAGGVGGGGFGAFKRLI